MPSRPPAEGSSSPGRGAAASLLANRKRDFYQLWNEHKPDKSPLLTSNREVDAALKRSLRHYSQSEFFERADEALRFVCQDEFHTQTRPCTAITLLRHLDTYAEQGRALAGPTVSGPKLRPGDRAIHHSDMLDPETGERGLDVLVEIVEADERLVSAWVLVGNSGRRLGMVHEHPSKFEKVEKEAGK